MSLLRIRPIYEPAKFTKLAIGINLQELKIVDGEAKAEIQPQVIYYSTCHFVGNKVPTTLTLELIPADGFHIHFTDFQDDDSGTIVWDALQKNHGYFRKRRFSLEPNDAPLEAENA